METSKMDLTNLTIGPTFDPDQAYAVEFEPLEILNAITCVASAIANILIISVIARYRIMRTRPNVYLANWCICNFIVMLLVPVPLNMFGLVDSITYEFVCLGEESLYGFLFGNLLFVVILLLDWYIVTYTREGCLTRCKKIHLFVIAIVWILILSISIASVTFCMLNWSYPLTLVCFILGYLLIFAVILVVYILRCIKIKICNQNVEKSKLELFIVTSYFICWLPNWISMYGQIFLRIFFSETYEHFTLFVGYSHAWIMLIVLYFFDKTFKKYFRKLFGVKERIIDDDASVHKDQSTVLL